VSTAAVFQPRPGHWANQAGVRGTCRRTGVEPGGQMGGRSHEGGADDWGRGGRRVQSVGQGIFSEGLLFCTVLAATRTSTCTSRVFCGAPRLR
jgi:hypothetical protein